MEYRCDANFLQETIEELAKFNLTPNDVQWVGDYDNYCDWDDFSKIADIDYDNDFGEAEINRSLYIVGYDWWLERREYDGREWWEFKRLPKKPKTKDKVKIWAYESEHQ